MALDVSANISYTGDMAEAPLIQALEARQNEEHLTARAMARRLGLHEAGWSRIRAGTQRPTRGMLLQALIAYPELRELIEATAAAGAKRPA